MFRIKADKLEELYKEMVSLEEEMFDIYLSNHGFFDLSHNLSSENQNRFWKIRKILGYDEKIG